VTMVSLRCLAKDPAARFSSASSMTATLAEAFNLPIPADMSPPLSQVDAMDEPTYLSPLEPTSLPALGSEQFSQPVIPASPQVFASAGSGLGNPTTPVLTTPGGSSPASASQHPHVLTPTQTSPAVGRQHRGWRLALIAGVILVLLASVLGGLYWYTHSARGAATSQVVGHVFFVNSGQITEHSNQGINDRLLIDLQNLPDPAPGKSYYAWLLGDEDQSLASPIPLGKLPVSNGNVHVLYQGDSHHTNLIGITSRFLVTEEAATLQPDNPSPDHSTWRYFAEIPHQGSSMDMMHESVLHHLRHLLADAPELTPLKLPGGLDIWLFRNTQKILEWAGSARDATDGSFIQRQVIRILAYLDGNTPYFWQEVPAGTPFLGQLPNAAVAVLEFDVQNQKPPGYLSEIGTHLNALTQSPGVTQEKRLLAAQIDQSINNMQNWLEQVHQDAKQLINTPTAQYNSPASQSILDDMAANALYAFIGRLDPSISQVQGGMIQIHYSIQSLATFDVTPFKP
jgi:hypothetical protein